MLASLRRLTFAFAASLHACAASPAHAAAADPTTPSTFVDPEGVLRWTATGAELAEFGVNYTTPFAHAFRAHQRLGIPLEAAIDADVYHFARLGFTAYRVHVWDREISDAAGNLLVNDQVRALDYLVAKLKARGIRIILTPLQFGNAGYPEPGAPLPGFTSAYGKRGSLEDRASWPLQERYLTQFIQHVNPFTGLAYHDDPDLIAVEINNEPGHHDHALALDYINRMAAALRHAGFRNPILYNMSHGLPVFQAYLEADVQGGTFQWYPANLVAGHEQRGNFLPYFDTYPIPFADAPGFRAKAKIVYEFDAADLGRAYPYPAIARAFRRAGIQFAAQFAYDPLHLAPFNTEYQTHYLNLAYTPQKALGLKIAAEAFRRVPRLHDYGAYPANTRFAGIRVSYEEDLAELVTPDTYFHSNSTTTPPPAPDQLTRVAGYGDSPLVTYPGRGAYFLDRLAPGVWRLELMPDALPVRDPFAKPSPRQRVTHIAWHTWPLTLRLPDLGAAFHVRGLNPDNPHRGHAAAGTVALRPGAYLLTRDGVTSDLRPADRWTNFQLGEYVAPPSSLDQPVVVHAPPGEATAQAPLRITATIDAPGPIERVELIASLPAPPPPPVDPALAQPGGGNLPGPGPRFLGTRPAHVFPMTRTRGPEFTAELPAAELLPGQLRYHLVVHTGGAATTFPGAHAGAPTDWDFLGTPWTTRLVPATAPLLLFAADTDTDALTMDHRGVPRDLVPADRPGTSALAFIAPDLAEGEPDFSLRFFFKDKIAGRAADLAGKRRLVLHARSATQRPCTVQVSLIMADGFAYGARVTVPPAWGPVAVPVAALRPVRSPNLPHGYPTFIPFWSPPAGAAAFELHAAESVLLSLGPGMAPADYASAPGIELERIWLE